METRRYGETDRWLSVVGFGGLLVTDECPSEASRIVAHAIERGVNYFDVAPQYGNAQEMLGPALAPYRQDVFLACKTLLRDGAGAADDLENSLRLLKTDHLDLYQFHSVTTDEDVDQILAPGGALEAAVRARDRGWVRHLGFSAHSEAAALRLLDAFAFDSILFPLNWATWHRGEFGPQVVEKARASGVAILALKALARRKLKENEDRAWAKSWYRPVESAEEAGLALRFTLSLPVTAAVSPGHEQLFDWACDAADSLTPLTDEEDRLLRERARDLEPVFSRSPGSPAC